MAKFIVEFEGRIAGLESAIKKLQDGFQNFAKNTEDATKKSANAFQDLGNKIEKGVDRAVGSVARWGAALTAIATGGGLAVLVKGAIEYEKALHDVASVSDEVAKNLKGYDEGLKAIAAGSSKDLTDITKGMYQAISAGIPATMGAGGALEFLNTAQKAATAGLATVKDAVTVGALVMNTFGQKAGTAADVFDALQTVVSRGVTRFPELAGTLGNVATAASQAGVGFHEMLASITLMTKGGLDAAKSTDALRALIISINAPTEEAIKLFKKLHIEYGTDAIAAKGLSGVVQDIIEKTGNSSVALRKLIPDVIGLQAAQILAKNSGRDLADEMEAQAKSSGAVSKAANIQEQTVSAAFERMGNSFRILASDVFERHGEAITEVIDNITKKVSEIDVEALADGIGGIAKALGLVVNALITIVNETAKAAKGLSEVISEGSRTGHFTEEGGERMEGSSGLTRGGQEYDADAAYRARRAAGRVQEHAADVSEFNKASVAAKEKADYDAHADVRRRAEAAAAGKGGSAAEYARKQAEEIAQARIDVAQRSIDRLLKMGEEKISREISQQMDAYGQMATGSDRLQKQISDNIDAEQKVRDAKIKERLVKELADAADNADARASFKKAADLEIQASASKTAKQRIDLAKMTLKQTQEEIARRSEPERIAREARTADEAQKLADRERLISPSVGAFVEGGFTGLIKQDIEDSKIGLVKAATQNFAAGNYFTGAVQAAGARFIFLVQSAGEFLYDKLASLVDLAGNADPSKFAGMLNGADDETRQRMRSEGMIVPQASGLFDVAKRFVDSLILNLPVLFAKLEPFIREMGPKIAAAIPVITQAFIAGIPLVLRAVLDQLPMLFDAVIAQIPGVIDALVGLLPMLITSFLTVVVPRLPTLAIAIVGGVISAFMSHIDDIVGAFIKGLFEGAGRFIDALIDAINPFSSGPNQSKKAGEKAKAAGVDPGMVDLWNRLNPGVPFPVDQILGSHDIGGKIESYIRGGMVGSENAILGGMRDAATRAAGVPAVLHPGERVLRAETTKRIEGMLEQAVAAGTGGGGAAQVVFQSMGGKGDRLLMELISHYVTASVNRNGRLISNVRQMAEGPEFVNYPRPIPALGY